MADSPEVIAALDDVVRERGWKLVSFDAVYTAELPGRTPTVSVSSANTAGLVLGIDSYVENRLRSSIDSITAGPVIVTRVVDKQKMRDVVVREDASEQPVDEED